LVKTFMRQGCITIENIVSRIKAPFICIDVLIINIDRAIKIIMIIDFIFKKDINLERIYLSTNI